MVVGGSGGRLSGDGGATELSVVFDDPVATVVIVSSSTGMMVLVVLGVGI